MRVAESLTHKLQGVEDDKITATLDVSGFVHIKNDALFCHRTQQPDLKKFSDRDLHELSTTEYFSLIHSNLAYRKKNEEDLFDGIR